MVITCNAYAVGVPYRRVAISLMSERLMVLQSGHAASSRANSCSGLVSSEWEGGLDVALLVTIDRNSGESSAETGYQAVGSHGDQIESGGARAGHVVMAAQDAERPGRTSS